MEQIANELTQYFLAHGLIKEDDAEVCQYALYRHISRAVGLIALTLLGGLITDFGSAFCFTVSFLFLRERTGGYHAKTEWQCALYSAAMIFATMFALPIFAEEVMIALYIDRLSVTDTAAKLRVDASTVRRRRDSACDKIRKAMEEK